MIFAFENPSTMRNFTDVKDKTISNLDRFCPTPVVNAVRNRLHYEGYVQRNKIESRFKILASNQVNKNYIISTGVHNGPAEWCGSGPDEKSVMSLLSGKYLKDLQEGRALFLIDQSFEGYHAFWLWDYFHDECERYKIPPQAVVYLTGNLIAPEVYDKWANDKGIKDRIKVVGYPHFEHDTYGTAVQLRIEGDPLPTLEDQLKYKEENYDKIKSYACLNKRVRSHRVWFYNKLFESGLLDKGLVSMNKFDNHGYKLEGKLIDEELRQQSNAILPLELYNEPNNVKDDGFYISRFNNQVCLDSWISVVSEPHFEDSSDTLFISEKAFKPILCAHPFIILGNKHSLAKMREMGFKTFDGLIDESYDNMSTHDRFDGIINTLKQIHSIKYKLDWYKEVSYIIEHNLSVLKERSEINLPVAYEEVEQYYNEYFKDTLNNVF